MNRVAKKRAVWDLSSEELVFLYTHLDKVVKKRMGMGTISPSEFFTLLKYPQSTLNFLADKKVSINDIDALRKRIDRKSK